MLASKAEYIIVNHVTMSEMETAYSTIYAVHKQMRHCVGFILCLEGSAPPGADYGFDVITDADFGEAHRVVAASARPVAPPEILRAAAFINRVTPDQRKLRTNSGSLYYTRMMWHVSL